MKPSKHEHGIILEDLGEIATAASAVNFLASTIKGPSKKDVEHLGKVLGSQSEALQQLAPMQERVGSEPVTTLEVGHEDNRFDALVVRKSLEAAAKSHPDELVRHSAQGMIHSYEDAIRQ